MTRLTTDRALAEALQRMLLPARLPSIEGWAIATLYEPAGETVLVGGDYYDWFTLPDGRVLFLVGDVAGKGPLAGALALSVRKALKGITWATGDLLVSLPLLEGALAEEFGDSFTTLCLVELTPGQGRLHVVLAGHPPPWLRRAGRFTEVAAPANTVLGPAFGHRWEGADIFLEPGDVLIVFTDGLTEARMPDGSLFGDGPWERFLDTLPPDLASFETVMQAEAHLRRVASRLPDDVIIGVLTFQPPAAAPDPVDQRPGAETRVLRLAPRTTSPATARHFVLDACRAWRIGEDASYVAETVTSELVTNAVLHARTDLEVRVSQDRGALRIAVWDACPTLPEMPEMPELPERQDLPLLPDDEHGRGLSLVLLLGAELHLEPARGGKVVAATLVT